jgi:hypothetical protein
MTDQRFEPTDPVAAELEQYAAAMGGRPSADFADAVMQRVAAETPARGFFARLARTFTGATLAGPWRRPVQGLAIGLVILLGIGGAAVAGQLLGVVRSVASPTEQPTPSPTLLPSPSAPVLIPSPSAPSSSPSPVLTPTPSVTIQPDTAPPASSSDEATPRPTPTSRPGSVEPSETSEPSETPEPSESAEESGSAKPSDDHGGSGGSATASPSDSSDGPRH